MLFYTNNLHKENLKITIKKEEKLLNKKNLWCEIKRINMKYPEIVFAQAILESGNLSSSLCKKYNNLFGMRLPRKRKTTAISESESKYAIYKDWSESVKDYKLFQEHIIIKGYNTSDKYIEYIDNKYSESIGYKKALYKIIKDNSYLLYNYS